MRALEQIEGFDTAGAGWHAVNVFQNHLGWTQINTYDSDAEFCAVGALRQQHVVLDELMSCWDPFSDWNREA